MEAAATAAADAAVSAAFADLWKGALAAPRQQPAPQIASSAFGTAATQTGSYTHGGRSATSHTVPRTNRGKSGFGDSTCDEDGDSGDGGWAEDPDYAYEWPDE